MNINEIISKSETGSVGKPIRSDGIDKKYNRENYRYRMVNKKLSNSDPNSVVTKYKNQSGPKFTTLPSGEQKPSPGFKGLEAVLSRTGLKGER